MSDAAQGFGFLFLEEVAPAIQGDVLVDPGDERADAAMRVIARVHAASWREHMTDHPAALPRWHAERWAEDRWSARLAAARARFPELLTDVTARRLERLPDELDAAIAALQGGPGSWIHTDAHLDNILWRPDGSAVLIDWAGASIGPPAVDLARFVIEGPVGLAADRLRATALLATYRTELTERGVPGRNADSVVAAVDQATLPLVQSIIGWAGRPGAEPAGPRMAALRKNALGNVVAWLSR